MCLAHYLLVAVGSKASLEQRLGRPSYSRNFIKGDSRRGLELSVNTLIALAQKPSATTFEPVPLGSAEIKAMRESLKTKTDSFEQDWRRTLAGADGGLSLDAFPTKPRADKNLSTLRIIQARSALSPSLSLVRPYDNEGKVAGYSTPGRAEAASSISSY